VVGAEVEHGRNKKRRAGKALRPLAAPLRGWPGRLLRRAISQSGA
jgi:hypothetical protein